MSNCKVLSLVLLFSLLRSSLEAQVLYGTVIGTIIDSSQSAVPSASVKLLNKATGQDFETKTNALGVFSMPTIPAGSYDIRVSMQGFQTTTQENVSVTSNNTVRVDFTLQVGAVTETIKITASSAALQTDSADVRAEIRAEEFAATPVPFTRNYQNLLITVPGMSPPQNAHSVAANPSRALQVNSNGTNSQSTNFRVDGATTGHPWLPHIAGYVPSLDAIETVNIVSNSFDAEQGYAGGAAVNVQIKSGGNAIHGSAYDHHSNQHLKARPYFLPANRDKEKRVINQWGGTVGGPIIKNKLFYFAAFEGTNDRQGAFATGSVPTPLMKQGNFSESTRLIYDPTTGNLDGSGRAPFANNILPASRISTASRKLADLTPNPNFGTGGIANNYFTSGPFAFDRKTLDSKVTWNATSKLNLNGRVSYLDWKCDDPAWFGQLGGGAVGRCSYDGKSFGHTLSMTYSGVYTLTPRFIIDAYVGYTLYDARVEPIRLDEKLGSEFLGIPNTNGASRLLGGWPGFSVGGFNTLGRGNSNAPWQYHSPQSQYVTNATYIKGNHNIRFGFDSMYVALNGNEPQGNPGIFSFGAGPTGLSGVATDSYNSYATFMLGLPTQIQKGITWADNTARTFAGSLYIRDKWQATRKLTISTGLRWDYFGVPTRADRGLELYDFSNNTIKLCGLADVTCDIKMSKKLIAPRLGLAYRATESFVIRAGFGIAYDPVNIARNPLHNYPLVGTYTFPAANGFQPAGDLRTGIPAIVAPDLSKGVIPVPNAVTMEIFDPNFRRSYVQSYNFMLQKEFKSRWTAEGGYVGNGSRHQQNRWNANYGSIGTGTAGRVLNQKFGRTADTNFISDTGGFNSSYNSFQSSLLRRFSSGYFAKFTYTYSKAIGPNGNQTGVDGYSMNNPAYFKLTKALQGYDRANMFTASGGAELPFGKGKRWANNGPQRLLLGGWQLNGLFTAYSGSPFTVSADGTALNAPNNAQRADQLKANVAILSTRDSWFDPLAFGPVTQARFGTAGFNILRAPGLMNLDASVFRNFAVGERFKVEFRAEAFNVSNTPHFSSPGANVNSLQFNADGTIRNLNGFTVINGVQNTGRECVDERMFRFALRIVF